MNPNDARITRVYTQESGGATAAIENTAPNATQPNPAATFDVVVELDAGSIVANARSPYQVFLVTFDETLGQTLGGAFTGPLPTVTTNFEPGGPWVAVSGSGAPDFELLAVTTFNVADIPTTPQRPLPHILKCYAALVSTGNQFVNAVESEPFVIVPVRPQVIP